ncbi:hypothetical protein JCM17204_26060 [Blautia stercoris]
MWDSSFIWNELEIKKLENKRAEKKCTATDARYFQIAENLLYMELGVALGKPKEEICKTIIDYINQSKQGN